MKLFCTQTKQVLQTQHIEKSAHEAFEELELDFSIVDAIGHRVVHGGEKFSSAVIVDEEVEKEIEALISLAPLHNPANLEGIRLARKKAPKIPQIAVFDTAFHSSMKEEAYLYALPIRLYEEHNIRRYGFHGTSHAFISKEAAFRLKRPLDEVNLITLHLGNGASVCAVKNGKSIDTSMGFTPLEGLIMGSRSGDVDPAIVLYLQRELKMSMQEVDRLLNKESGLLGICGKSDMRKIEQSSDAKTKLALDMAIRRISKYIGSYMALLENVDAIVFSGGIGENSTYIRQRVMKNKMFENIECLVIKTDEELEILNECLGILK